MKKISKKKINCDIITGSSGFIAQQFIKRYNNTDKIFICFDKKKKKYSKNIKFFKININNFFELKKILQKLNNYYNFNTIWHFAANSDIRKSNKNINTDFKDTFCTTLSILTAIQDLNLSVKKINFSSSSAIYGKSNFGLVENCVNIKTSSHYGSMKLSSESILSSFCFLNNLKCSIFRFPNVVGPKMTHGLIYDLKKKIKKNFKFLEVLGNGSQTKQYLHVSDLIDAMIFINTKDISKFSIYNISSGDKGISVRKIVNLFVKLNKISPKIIYGKNNFGWKGDIPKFKFNVTKINKLGWKAKTNSEFAVKKAILENLI